jgi:hypothetical protein
LVDQKALEMMPSGLAINQIFKGDGQLHFKQRKQQKSIPNNKKI